LEITENGKTLDDLPIERFIGKTVLLSVDDKFPKNMGFAFAEGEITRNINVQLLETNPKFVIVGSNALLDVEEEKQLLQSGIITITNLINMEKLPKNKPFMFYGVPLKIKKRGMAHQFGLLQYWINIIVRNLAYPPPPLLLNQRKYLDKNKNTCYNLGQYMKLKCKGTKNHSF